MGEYGEITSKAKIELRKAMPIKKKLVPKYGKSHRKKQKKETV